MSDISSSSIIDNQRRELSMGGGTKYSRDTTNKNALRSSIQQAPKYGNKACNLCYRGRYPEDLSFKVSKYKTCADVQLELSLIDPSKATCEAGQDAYREMCCPQKTGFDMPKIKFPLVSVAAGLFLFWIFTRKIRKIQSAPPSADEDDDEVGEGKKYQRMNDDQSNGSKRQKRSKSRERNLQRSRSKSRERNLQRSRSKSRERNLQRSRSKESKFSKSSKHSASTKPTTNFLPDMLDMTFQNKKKFVPHKAINASNLQQQEQRRLQQQYFGTNHQQGGVYHLEDDNTAYGDSTLGGADTVAGDSSFAVITQVV
jgi:hypothetical protein